MKKLLTLALLLATTCAHAQDANPQVKATLAREAEYEAYQRRHDSTLVAQAKRRKEIQAYNAEYRRTHPAKKPASKPAKKRP